MKHYDVQSAAAIAGVSRQTIGRMIQSGALEAVQIRAGKRKSIVRVPETALRKLLHVPRNESLEPAVIAKNERTTGTLELAVVGGGQD